MITIKGIRELENKKDLTSEEKQEIKTYLWLKFKQVEKLQEDLEKAQLQFKEASEFANKWNIKVERKKTEKGILKDIKKVIS